MKNSCEWLRAEFALNFTQHSFQIGNEMRHIVARAAVRWILAVIANIKQNQVVSIAKRIPERVVRIDRQPIAMTQDQARTLGIFHDGGRERSRHRP